jgi:hypothetical protein
VKRTLLIVLAMVAINTLVGFLTEAHAQQTPAVGAYQEASVTDADVKTAARYAVRKEKQRRGDGSVKLVSIERAEKQVVAGMNYRLCLRVKIKGKIRRVTTTVYKNLEQMHALTSWKPGACGSGT